MYQFFESIKVKDGVIYNLSNHQDRVNRTLKNFGISENKIALTEIVKTVPIPKKSLYKLRISYGLEGRFQHEMIPYQYKKISKFSLVDIKGQQYDFKFENRAWINDALLQSGKDEIMMHDAGFIKDSSYANLVFFDGSKWYTPAKPLLEGTQRAKLLKDGIIQAKAIHINELDSFHSFRLINAMMLWENSTEYSISLISIP